MRYITRFNPYHRILHIVVMVSFLGLTASGIPLKFSTAPWAAWLMKFLGGYHSAGIIHRVCAVLTFGYFVAHIAYIIYYIVIVRRFRFNIFGPESMIPNLKDLQDIIGHFKWFLGKGPRPQFDRWTYWEKFDYWAVFWGVGMIGVSGLFLWFPVFFGKYFPGWAFNIATIIHSDEALLAAGFIFTIHFFNTHMRPEKFPMDTVIFTGKLTYGEFQHERPMEYARAESGKAIAGMESAYLSPSLFMVGTLFGLFVLCIGFVLLVLIVVGLLA